MKKILLTFGLCISVLVSGDQVSGMDTAAVAENFTGTNTVYLYGNASGAPLSAEQKTRIWEIETTLKFPACVGDSNFERNLALHPGLLENELDVFKQKLGVGYEITPCSKSLYQLFILKYFSEIARSLELLPDTKNLHIETFRQKCRACVFALHPTGTSIAGWLRLVPVQKLFWDVNDCINGFISAHSENRQELWTTSRLKQLSEALIDDLSSAFDDENTSDAIYGLLDMRSGENFPSIFWNDNCNRMESDQREQAKGTLIRCLSAEIDTMVDGRLAGYHSLYRGEKRESSFRNTTLGSRAFSFGDGALSGFIFDGESGVPFVYALRTKYLVRVDFSKQTIITRTCPFFLNFAPTLASGMGRGEYYHPRSRVTKDSVDPDKGIPGSWYCTGLTGARYIPNGKMDELISDSADFTIPADHIVEFDYSTPFAE